MTQHDLSVLNSNHVDQLPTRDGQPRMEPLQVTISEAARLLAYNTRTIRRLIGRGELRAVGEGRLRRIPLHSLRDYQQRHLMP